MLQEQSGGVAKGRVRIGRTSPVLLHPLTCCVGLRETDLDEVLQIPTIFTNVSKGVVARRQDLKKAFGTVNEEKILKQMLQKGTLQVSGEERKREMDTQFRYVYCVPPFSLCFRVSVYRSVSLSLSLSLSVCVCLYLCVFVSVSVCVWVCVCTCVCLFCAS